MIAFLIINLIICNNNILYTTNTTYNTIITSSTYITYGPLQIKSFPRRRSDILGHMTSAFFYSDQ